MANTIKVKESDIKNAIYEAVLGMNGDDLEGLGLTNPANDYTVNYTELAEKCESLREYLQSFKTYIDGVEEDAENGVEKQDGVRTVATMRSYWSDDLDDKELADILKELSWDLYKIESSLTETASQAQYMAQWQSRMNSRR